MGGYRIFNQVNLFIISKLCNTTAPSISYSHSKFTVADSPNESIFTFEKQNELKIRGNNSKGEVYLNKFQQSSENIEGKLTKIYI